MFEKGTMIPSKKVVGVILIILGLSSIFIPASFIGFVSKYLLVFGLVELFAGYLLYIAGRQR